MQQSRIFNFYRPSSPESLGDMCTFLPASRGVAYVFAIQLSSVIVAVAEGLLSCIIVGASESTMHPFVFAVCRYSKPFSSGVAIYNSTAMAAYLDAE